MPPPANPSPAPPSTGAAATTAPGNGPVPALQLALAQQLDAALPQTQCTRCGYPDCHAYAMAMAEGAADINRCPPGGAEGIERLARISGRPVLPLDTQRGTEGPRLLAVIDEAWCIGCTLCIKACPVDCIVGASKQMHSVINEQCTGCELCVPVCPVDCISLVPVTAAATGWQAWSTQQASEARTRYAWHQQRTVREQTENDERLAAKAQTKLADLAAHSQHTDPDILAAKRAVIEAALVRARAKRETPEAELKSLNAPTPAILPAAKPASPHDHDA